jgi:hypothetical protein
MRIVSTLASIDAVKREWVRLATRLILFFLEGKLSSLFLVAALTLAQATSRFGRRCRLTRQPLLERVEDELRSAFSDLVGELPIALRVSVDEFRGAPLGAFALSLSCAQAQAVYRRQCTGGIGRLNVDKAECEAEPADFRPDDSVLDPPAAVIPNAVVAAGVL